MSEGKIGAIDGDKLIEKLTVESALTRETPEGKGWIEALKAVMYWARLGDFALTAPPRDLTPEGQEYPTDRDLELIEKWDFDDWEGLLNFIRPMWEHYGRMTRKKKFLELATGGWSGNESIIGALRKTIFWMIAWEESKRGGYFKFDLSTVAKADEAQKESK